MLRYDRQTKPGLVALYETERVHSYNPGARTGRDNWSYEMYKAPVKSSPPTNQHPLFYRPDALPVAQPTMSEH